MDLNDVRIGQLVRITKEGNYKNRLGLVTIYSPVSDLIIVAFLNQYVRFDPEDLELVLQEVGTGRQIVCKDCGRVFKDSSSVFLETNQIELCWDCFLKDRLRCQ